jgi:hypothetical protein
MKKILEKKMVLIAGLIRAYWSWWHDISNHSTKGSSLEWKFELYTWNKVYHGHR